MWQATAIPSPPTDRHAPDSMALIPDWNLIGPGLVLKWFNVVKETLLAAFRASFGLWPIQIGPTESAHHPSAITALASLCPLEQTGLAANIASNTTAVMLDESSQYLRAVEVNSCCVHLITFQGIQVELVSKQ